MKVFIRPNATTKTGYEIVSIDDLGNEKVQPITDVTHDDKSYILPENPSNRKYWAKSRVGNEPVELTYKESRTFGPRGESGEPRKKLTEYLTEEEKATIEGIWAKARERRAADRPKPLTEKEKLERQLAKLKEKLAELEGGNE